MGVCFFILISYNMPQLQSLLSPHLQDQPKALLHKIHCFSISLQKRPGLPKASIKKSKEDAIILGINPNIKAECGNSIGAKKSEEKAIESETPLLSLLEIQENCQVKQSYHVFRGPDANP